MKKRVDVTFEVLVEIDESKFTEEFMEEFDQHFYPGWDINHHIEHIAQLKVRGLLTKFTEGYGEIKDMGIHSEIIDYYTDTPIDQS